MNSFALIAIGILVGVLFILSILSTSVLAYVAWRTHRQYNEVVTQMKDTALVTQQLVHRVDGTRFEHYAKVMTHAADKLKFVAEYFDALYKHAQPPTIGQPDHDTGKFPDEDDFAAEGESALGYAKEEGS